MPKRTVVSSLPALNQNPKQKVYAFSLFNSYLYLSLNCDDKILKIGNKLVSMGGLIKKLLLVIESRTAYSLA